MWPYQWTDAFQRQLWLPSLIQREEIVDVASVEKTSIYALYAFNFFLSFHFQLSSAGKRGVTTQRLTTSASGIQMLPRLDLRLTCDGVPVIGTVPGVFMRIPHPKPLARFLGRRPSLHLARPQPSTSPTLMIDDQRAPVRSCINCRLEMISISQSPPRQWHKQDIVQTPRVRIYGGGAQNSLVRKGHGATTVDRLE